MREPRNDKARGQAGQGAQQGRRNTEHTTDVANVNARRRREPWITGGGAA